MFQNQTPGIYVANDHELRQQYGDFINDILVIFLSHGLNPNFTTTKKSRHLSGGSGNAFDTLVGVQQMDQIYRSRVYSQTPNGFAGLSKVFVTFQIQAFIYLRHLHSFFSQIPLLKGVFFRLTLNLNNTRKRAVSEAAKIPTKK